MQSQIAETTALPDFLQAGQAGTDTFASYSGTAAHQVRIPEELGEVWIGPYEANGFYYVGTFVFIQTRPPRWRVE